jgi:hypothetical protein
MEVTVHQKKREVVMKLTAEELAKMTGMDTVEKMMTKYTMTGMKGACVDAFSPRGIKIDYKKVA